MRVTEEWSEDDVRALFSTCSNDGRWGSDDELGTLNLITPAKRRRSLNLATAGLVIPLGRPLPTIPGGAGKSSAFLQLSTRMVGNEIVSVGDVLTVEPHGFDVTHLDALGHVFYADRAYNGRSATDILASDGLARTSIVAAAGGIVTRAVLLDVARARGVDYLDAGTFITADDLASAERMAGAKVEPGDAVFVRSGVARRVATGGIDSPEFREGLAPDAIPWLHQRDVALYSGDCIERLPSGYPGIPLPLHQIGMVAMGLWFLDNPDLEALRRACDGRHTAVFTLIVAPLIIPGATGSVVNPLALF
jgi:kynurenine formamidase